jgi:hypothetical protein
VEGEGVGLTDFLNLSSFDVLVTALYSSFNPYLGGRGLIRLPNLLRAVIPNGLK